MKIEFQVQNLKCGGCANTIVSKLEAMEDVKEVQVNPDSGMVKVSYGAEPTAAVLREKLRTLGYPVLEDDNGVLLKAKSYISCAVGRFGN
ncbi:heavy-metal-associated domain-containing protein [Flagellimonas algicola]|uniref:Heavy-metal-associated domain-containing protein n=1 Tax=Flagellimonas algicola TaxID=2583815 RepID=A0ABY2WJP8_9FLAO|nr:heavy-metal-associated domain-containing protein [Allomuricauda algicola]TMU54781.1 heavy-metal-associated domain-containing protein [Allomuricauda algicola]